MSEDVGFCCRCSKETNRQETTGMIVTWVCSVSCAVKASTEFAKPPTPECDKLSAAAPFSQVCGEFIDWLQNEKEIVFAAFYEDKEEQLHPYPISTQELLSAFFQIDQEAVEMEKRAILKKLQEFELIIEGRKPK